VHCSGNKQKQETLSMFTTGTHCGIFSSSNIDPWIQDPLTQSTDWIQRTDDTCTGHMIPNCSNHPPEKKDLCHFSEPNRATLLSSLVYVKTSKMTSAQSMEVHRHKHALPCVCTHMHTLAPLPAHGITRAGALPLL
jgi:hypothetical protein